MELVPPMFTIGQKGWGTPVRTILASGVDLDVRGLDMHTQKEPLFGEARLAIQTLLPWVTAE
jgi:hypothetical protein